MTRPRSPEVISFADFQELVPFFRTPLGARVLRRLIPLTGLPRIDHLYAAACDAEGPAFVDALFRELQLTCAVSGSEHLDAFRTAPFVTVSNHPFGSVDGLLLVRLLGALRPDYKVLVNRVLRYVKPLDPWFIGVDPVPGPEKGVSVTGLRKAFRHVREGHPLGLFPAGSVSRFDARFRVADRAWQPSVIRLIQQLRVPVVPVFFHGHNSVFYNLLGLIDWRLRSLRLPREVLNKRGRQLAVTVAPPIAVPEALYAPDRREELGRLLREQTYRLARKQ